MYRVSFPFWDTVGLRLYIYILWNQFKTYEKIYFFIAPLLKIRFSVPVKRDETAIFNPRGETLEVGLQTALSSRFTGTENKFLKIVAMKNSMHYSKQNTAIANEREVCCPSEARAAVTRVAFAVSHPF